MNRFTTSVEYHHRLPAEPYLYNDSYQIPSPQYSCESPFDTESLSDKSKKIRKKRNTYMKIEDNARIKLLEAVQEGETLKAAAKRYNINYSSAKSILHTFRKEGRILKKSAQERTARKRAAGRASAEIDMELSPIYLTKHYHDDEEEAHGHSNYQTYHSPETAYKSGASSYEDEVPKAGYKTLAINTFGGFLKVDNQSFHRPENLNVQVPASTLTLKLDSIGKPADSKVQSLQGKNWQLNVNVHNKPSFTTTTTEPLNLPDDLPVQNTYPLKIQTKLRSFKNNSSSSPMPRMPRLDLMSRNESKGFSKDFDAFADMLACNDEKAPTEPHNFDVSYFLSSPNSLYQRRISDANPFANYDYFGLSENLRYGYSDLAYESAKRMSSSDPLKAFEEGNVIKTAGLQ